MLEKVTPIWRTWEMNKRLTIWYLKLRCIRRKKTILLLLLHFWLTSANSLEYWFKAFTRMLGLLWEICSWLYLQLNTANKKGYDLPCVYNRDNKEHSLKTIYAITQFRHSRLEIATLSAIFLPLQYTLWRVIQTVPHSFVFPLKDKYHQA